MSTSFATRLLVIDTESTGLDPATDRIVELAAVYFEDRAFRSLRQMLIDPGVPIPEEASKIHHITDERVHGKPRFAAVADAFLKHVDGTAEDGSAPVLVGYNAITYDIPLINAELARHGVDRALDASRVVDPIYFIRHSLRHMRQRSLGSMCEHYGIPLVDAHRAGADARATGELLFRLVEAGVVPDDVERALSQQAEYRATVEAEWDEFSYWLFRDREDGGLRLGAGKHCGLRLDEVETSYLAYLTRTIADLPEAVKLAFATRS